MSQSEFKTAIVDAVEGSGAIFTYLSGVWETEAPTDSDGESQADFPYLVYNITSDSPPESMQRNDFEATVQFDIYQEKNVDSTVLGTNNDLIFALLRRPARISEF